MHQISLPLLKSAADPSKNIRNIFLGYLTVFITYLIVGCLGYVGFTGSKFDKVEHDKNGIIEIT